MSRKLYARFYRFALNIWPCIRRTGGRVTYISDDFRELKVKLPLNWKTRNIVGTIFGGSMYASTDPFFMLMLMQVLGKDYVVWDKACAIRFKKPAKHTIYADFKITDQMLTEVKNNVAQNHYTNVTWTIEYKDSDGNVYAEFDKVLYISTKESYKKRQHHKRSQT